MLLLNRHGAHATDAAAEPRLAADTPTGQLAATLLTQPMISIEFGHFADGRGLSLAAHLRQALHYRGTLRACGQLLPDQFQELLLSGFDEILVTDDSRHDDWLKAAQPIISRSYISPPANDSQRSIWAQRHAVQ